MSYNLASPLTLITRLFYYLASPLALITTLFYDLASLLTLITSRSVYNLASPLTLITGRSFYIRYGQSTHTDNQPFLISGQSTHTDNQPFLWSGQSTHIDNQPFLWSGQSTHIDNQPFLWSGQSTHIDNQPFLWSGQSTHIDNQQVFLSVLLGLLIPREVVELGVGVQQQGAEVGLMGDVLEGHDPVQREPIVHLQWAGLCEVHAGRVDSGLQAGDRALHGECVVQRAGLCGGGKGISMAWQRCYCVLWCG